MIPRKAPKPQASPEGWWLRFFTPAFFPLAGAIPAADTRAEIRALTRLIAPGAKILDVACGIGRHSLPLAAAGHEVTGVDSSAEYLAQARRAGVKAGVRVRFLRRDMRALGFSGRFDAVINLWTSFGYLPTPRDDIAALRSMRAALRPSGTLILEVVDGAWLSRNPPPAVRARRGSAMIEQRSRIEEGGDPACVTEWTFAPSKGAMRRARSFVRLYDRARLAAALRRAGFARVRLGEGLAAREGRALRGARILAVARGRA